MNTRLTSRRATRAPVVRPGHDLAAHHDAVSVGEGGGTDGEVDVVVVDVEVDDDFPACPGHPQPHGGSVVGYRRAQGADARVRGRKRVGQGGRGVGAAVLAYEKLVVEPASLQARHDFAHLGLEDLGFVVHGDHDRQARCASPIMRRLYQVPRRLYRRLTTLSVHPEGQEAIAHEVPHHGDQRSRQLLQIQ